jgi:hypothetical protein
VKEQQSESERKQQAFHDTDSFPIGLISRERKRPKVSTDYTENIGYSVGHIATPVAETSAGLLALVRS